MQVKMQEKILKMQKLQKYFLFFPKMDLKMKVKRDSIANIVSGNTERSALRYDLD
jgi:hypothetical protein